MAHALQVDVAASRRFGRGPTSRTSALSPASPSLSPASLPRAGLSPGSVSRAGVGPGSPSRSPVHAHVAGALSPFRRKGEAPTYNPLHVVGASQHGGKTTEDGSSVGSDSAEVEGNWPAVTARVVNNANSDMVVRVHNVPSRLPQLFLEIERAARVRVVQLKHKGTAILSTSQWREEIHAFWVAHGRRARARQTAVMRTVATGLRKRRTARVRQAAHEMWELAQRQQLRAELLAAVGPENLVRALHRCKDEDALCAMISAAGAFASEAAGVKALSATDLIATLFDLRLHTRQLDSPRLFFAVAILLHLFAGTMRGAAHLVAHLDQTLPCIAQLLRSKTVEPRRLAVETIVHLLKADRSVVAPNWCANWGWFPVLAVVKQSNVTRRELTMVAAAMVEVARDESLVHLLCNTAATEVVFLLLQNAQRFLTGPQRNPNSRQRQMVKDTQALAASLLWVIASHKDPGVALFSIEARVHVVLDFLNSPMCSVATAGAGLAAHFASGAKFAKLFVEEGGVVTLLRRARTASMSAAERSSRLTECAVAALVPLAAKHSRLMWQQRADDWLFDALAATPDWTQPTEGSDKATVAFPNSSRVAAARTLLLLAKGSFGRAHRSRAHEAVAMAMRAPLLPCVHMAALATWYLAHNAIDNTGLGDAGVIDSLLQWLAVLQLVHGKRLAPSSSSAMLQFAQQVAANPHRAIATTECLVGALWLLMFDRTGKNITRFTAAGGFEILSDLLHDSSHAFRNVQYIVIGCLWTLSVTEQGVQPLLSTDAEQILSRVLHLATSDATSTNVRIFAAGFLIGLLHNGHSRTSSKASAVLQRKCGPDFEADMLYRLVSSETRDYQEWGASMVARAFATVKLKRSFCRLQGPVVLLKLLKDGGPDLDDDPVVLNCCHALLNLSTESSNQALIGKHGITKLVALSYDEDAPNLRGFSARILANLLKHADNRTPLYREELRIKSKQWHGEVTETEGHVQEYERRMLQAYESPLRLKGSDRPEASVKDAFSQWVDGLADDPTVATSTDVVSGRHPGSKGGVSTHSAVAAQRRKAGKAARAARAAQEAKAVKAAKDAKAARARKAARRNAQNSADSGAQPSGGTEAVAVELALRKHPQYHRGLQRVLCAPALGNLSRGGSLTARRADKASVFLTQGGGPSEDAAGGAPIVMVDTPRRGGASPSRGAGKRKKKKKKQKSRKTRAPRVNTLATSPVHQLVHSPLRNTGSYRRRANDKQKAASRSEAQPAVESPSSLAAARAEARHLLKRGVAPPPPPSGKRVLAKGLGPPGASFYAPKPATSPNPFQHSLSAPLLASARSSKALRATHSSDTASHDASLRSKFRYHVRRAILKRQKPSFMRIVELAKVEQEEGRRVAQNSFTEASTGQWDPIISATTVFEYVVNDPKPPAPPAPATTTRPPYTGNTAVPPAPQAGQEAGAAAATGATAVQAAGTGAHDNGTAAAHHERGTVAASPEKGAAAGAVNAKKGLETGAVATKQGSTTSAGKTKNGTMSGTTAAKPGSEVAQQRPEQQDPQGEHAGTKDQKGEGPVGASVQRVRHEVFTDVALRQAPISVHVSKGVSARHRIQFNRSPEQAHKEWEERQLKKHLGPTVRMCLFEHVEGSTVCQGLFKHFTLPNGKTVHYYHQDTLHEIVADTVVKPPRPPLALRDIFQDRVPDDGVHAHPLDSDVQATPPVPGCAPVRPHEHLLPVDEHVCGDQFCTKFGVLPGDDPIHLTVDTDDTHAPMSDGEMRIADDMLEQRRASFSLYDSVFIGRLVNADSKDFYNDNRVGCTAFASDWRKVIRRTPFRAFLDKMGCNREPSQIEELREVVARHYALLADTFVQYAALGTGSSDAFSVDANSLLLFAAACNIPDESSKYVARHHIKSLVASIKADARLRDGRSKRALYRFEFLEAVMRMGLAKYMKSKAKVPAGEAMELLMSINILPVLGPGGSQPVHRCDEWRQRFLYRESVNEVLESWYGEIKAVFKLYANKELNSRRSRDKGFLLTHKQWERFLGHAKLHSKLFGQVQGVLAFTRSVMRAHDDVKHRTRACSLSFPDFVEALCRVAFVSSMPTVRQLAAVGASNAHEYFENPVVMAAHERRGSSTGEPQTRPLGTKLQRLLELIRGRLAHADTDRDRDADAASVGSVTSDGSFGTVGSFKRRTFMS